MYTGVPGQVFPQRLSVPRQALSWLADPPAEWRRWLQQVQRRGVCSFVLLLEIVLLPCVALC